MSPRLVVLNMAIGAAWMSTYTLSHPTQQLVLTATEYQPEVDAVMPEVVAPVFHLKKEPVPAFRNTGVQDVMVSRLLMVTGNTHCGTTYS